MQHVLDYMKLHTIYKAAAHALSYGDVSLIQYRIDQEGCGSVFSNFVGEQL